MSNSKRTFYTLHQAADELRRDGQSVDSCYYSIRHCMRRSYWRPSEMVGNAYIVLAEEMPALRAALEKLTPGRPTNAAKSRGIYLRSRDEETTPGEPERATS